MRMAGNRFEKKGKVVSKETQAISHPNTDL